jgi:hypothetical protein
LAEPRLGVTADAANGGRDDSAAMSATRHRRRSARTTAPDRERYEVCELRRGTARPRVLATAGSCAAARLAVRTLVEEGEAARGRLMIRDALTGRQLRA